MVSSKYEGVLIRLTVTGAIQDTVCLREKWLNHSPGEESDMIQGNGVLKTKKDFRKSVQREVGGGRKGANFRV